MHISLSRYYKIISSCTCTLKVIKHTDKTVTTDVYFTYYGHSKNMGYTWISKNARNEVAAK